MLRQALTSSVFLSRNKTHRHMLDNINFYNVKESVFLRTKDVLPSQYLGVKVFRDTVTIHFHVFANLKRILTTKIKSSKKT